MYAAVNFKTKKALKEAIAEGREVGVFQPNDMFGKTSEVYSESFEREVAVTLEGPHYPQPHKWYAQAWVRNGKIVRVK